MGRMKDKVAIVTGAARGTGAATARLLAAEGARVMLADVLEEAGEAVAAEIGADAHFAALDVTREADWKRVVEQTQRRWGRVDVLVNNAAVLHMEALDETRLEDFERVVAVNQRGPFLGMKSVAPLMKQAGQGSIVNVSSIDGMSAKNALIAYAGSKWALRGMTRVAALELGKFGIRVNVVCPEAGSGDMLSPFMPEGVDPEIAAKYSQRILSSQMERSIADKLDDVARMILFLASDESASCTGTDFLVDGGYLAGFRFKQTPGG